MARKGSKTHSAAQQPGPSRRIHDAAPDAQRKLPELAACPRCRASYRNGRWTWEKPPLGSYEHVCPACERIAADYPAGVLHVEGAFAASHRDELVGLVRNIEERERARHPLKRIMAVADEASGFCVSVTDAKLVESFGRALQSAYEGRLEHPPTTRDKQNLVRIHWTRD